MLNHQREHARWNRQVERSVATRALFVGKGRHGGGQGIERGVIGEVAGHEPEALRELGPHVLAELGAGVLAHRVVDFFGEVLIAVVPAGETDQCERRREQSPIGQVVHGWHQLLAGQITGNTEYDQSARTRHARQSAVDRAAQRILALELGLSHLLPLSAARAASTVARSSSQATLNLSTPSVSNCSNTASMSTPSAARSSNTC